MKLALVMAKGKSYSFKNRPLLFRHQPDSLTLASLHGIVKSCFPNIDVEIFDESVEIVDPQNIDADLIGISALTPAIYRAYEIADNLRARGRTVFIGGVHATLNPQEAKQHADAIICGLADATLPELIKDIQNRSLKDFYFQSTDCHEHCFPSRHIYENKHPLGTEISYIQGSFGCPNSCAFCVQPYFNSGLRSVDNIIEEIKLINSREIEFLDPNLSRNKRFLIELCQKLIPLKKRWFAPVTSEIYKDKEVLKLMQKSGCKGVLIGFESVNKKSLVSINKKFNSIADYRNCVKALHTHGIEVTGSFVLGLDGDDKNTFYETLCFVNDAKIEYPRFTINTPYPGTKYFEHLKEEGRILTEDWDLYDCHHCVFQPMNLSPSELEKGFQWLWKSAYAPSSIIKRTFSRNPFKFAKNTLLNQVFGHIYNSMLNN